MSVNCRHKDIWIIDQRKARCRQRIPKTGYVRKYAVDINIFITSRNDRKIMHSVKITTGPPMRTRKWNQPVSLDGYIPK